jgi:hypothetical protein
MLAEARATLCANGYRRQVAAISAVLVLLAQLVAVGHVHPDLLVKSVSTSTHAMVGDLSCPVCMFQAHTSANAAKIFLLVLPFLSEAFVATARRSRLLVARKSPFLGRAPPAFV